MTCGRDELGEGGQGALRRGTDRRPEVKLVRAAIFARRIRDNSFPEGLFGEPAWDCLLDLYLALLEERPVSVTDVCVAASVPPTTARRWLDVLCDKALVMQLPEPAEPRSVLVELTTKGEALMKGYFGRVPAHWNGC